MTSGREDEGTEVSDEFLQQLRAPRVEVRHRTYLSQVHFSHSLKTTCFILAAVWGVSLFSWLDPLDLGPYLVAEKRAIFEEGQWWRGWTSVWVHADFEHFLSNSFLFLIMGASLHAYFGPTLFPMTAFALSGVVTLLSIATYPEGVQLVGASGLVYFLGGLWPALFMAIERQRGLGNRIFRTLGMAIFIWMPQTILPQVSYRTHALGFFLGFVSGLIFFAFKRRNFQSYERVEERMQ